MAINPFRIGQLEIPANPQQRPIDWSGAERGLAALGEGLGRYREQQQLGEIMAGAVDPATGELDWNKAAKAIAISGRDPTKVLSQLTARESLARQEAAQQATEANYLATRAETERANRERERLQQQQADKPQYEYVKPTLMTPGHIIEQRPGKPPIFHPWTGAPAEAAPGPQSEAAPGVLSAPGPTAALNPEQAPPYQVAGPPTPPPTAPAAAPVAAPAPVRNEDFLRTLPAGGQELIRGLADYKIDPAKATPEMLAAVRRYRPDYDQGEYAKRGAPPSGEVAARIGLAKAFMEKVPAIRERLQANELNSWQGAATAIWGTGGPGELRRAIDEGSEALLRGLTGAGMNPSEAAAYARRYQFDLRDKKDDALRKLNELDNALRHVTTEVGKGRGGEDLLKGFQSQFGKEVAAPKKIATDEEANTLIGQARGALKRDPEKRDEILKRLRERGVRNPELMLGQ